MQIRSPHTSHTKQKHVKTLGDRPSKTSRCLSPILKSENHGCWAKARGVVKTSQIFLCVHLGGDECHLLKAMSSKCRSQGPGSLAPFFKTQLTRQAHTLAFPLTNSSWSFLQRKTGTHLFPRLLGLPPHIQEQLEVCEHYSRLQALF